ncbi:hypothetical protein [Lonepinella koalarum]|uniref:hypothetical protein n=1 Tax=Lonepinella koalarum TaxID=53417 RepID=UPI003F6DF16E
MQELIKSIEQWVEESYLIYASNLHKPFNGLVKNIDELIKWHNCNDLEKIKNTIGHCFIYTLFMFESVARGGDRLRFYINEIFQYYELSQEKNSVEAVSSNFLLYQLGKVKTDFYIKDVYAAVKIGLIVQNLVHYSHNQGLDFKDCVQHAYNQIKDRKGKMIDGVFVKEEDL